MKRWKAEIIAIGDELTSGARLDTNTQWLACELAELGIETRFHSTIGDDQADGVLAFKTAMDRADVVISTGGIGPTKDDLTRQVLADLASVPLEYHPEVLEHIRTIYRRLNRDMPISNQHQAWFPRGSSIIPNREGTAPGIDQRVSLADRHSRIFALPGVPYEMKEMWADYVRPALQIMTGQQQVIRQHVVHCFGAGESQIENMLSGLTDRRHWPRVGITASHATISLRITASGKDERDCLAQIRPTLAVINERLGDLVFGENGIELQDVLVQMLADRRQTIALVDYGFGGTAGQALFRSDSQHRVCPSALAMGEPAVRAWLGSSTDMITGAARKIRNDARVDMGVAVGPPKAINTENDQRFQMAIADKDRVCRYELHYGGHPGLRQARTTKQILNQIRMHLLKTTARPEPPRQIENSP